ncbi:hypothetical protein ACIHAR_06610 [Streptomyces sp. NPDC052016]|uniref:hypothetical protein n=1 Tax=unclassified Streptomyces TaxID=2593676 RepID=UPI00341A8594
MTTGGDTGPRAAPGGVGNVSTGPPRLGRWLGRALLTGGLLTGALLTGGLLAGCGTPGAQDAATAGAPAAPGSASNSPSPGATPPEALCARIVAYWSREVLDGTTYGDYQSMGLSNGQYEILRDVVDTARARKEKAGRRAAEELIDRDTRTACAELYRGGAPTKGPWQ